MAVLVALVGITSGLFLSPVGAVQAASPAPTLAPQPTDEPGEEFAMEAWLDAAIPAGAPPGSTLHVGALIWIRGAEELGRGGTFRIFLHPASGSAEPAFDYGYQDFAGHVVADLIVPAGGAGDLEIFIPGTICENDVCLPGDSPIPVRGVGPPPKVPLTALASAFLSPPIEALVAAKALAFDIDVEPKVDWAAPGLALPETLWLQAREPQGPPVLDVEAVLVDADARTYRASLTFEAAGDYVLEAGIRPDAEGDDLLASSVRRITVEPATSEPASEAGGEAAGWAAWLLPGAIAVVLAALLAIAATRTRGRSQAR